MKKGIRVIGIDDSPFEKFGKEERVLIVGVVQREKLVEGILSAHIKKDGTDATEKIFKLIKNSRFSPQIKLLLLNGIMAAGFNVIDINKLSGKLKIPIIAITRKRPDKKKVIDALSKLKEVEGKIRTIEEVSESHKISYKNNKFFIQIAGTDFKTAEEMIKYYGIEPLRLAHLIGSGIIKGESSGRI